MRAVTPSLCLSQNDVYKMGNKSGIHLFKKLLASRDIVLHIYGYRCV